MNFHPHLHFLTTEGGRDKDGRFHKVSHFDDAILAQFFSREVFLLSLKEGFINLELVREILLWRHSGFNVHSKVRERTKKEEERVGKYMIRPLLSFFIIFLSFFIYSLFPKNLTFIFTMI
ncbi:MAG: transposase [Acidobacteriota bacterium]